MDDRKKAFYETAWFPLGIIVVGVVIYNIVKK
jgi:predicted membrane-bound dolichyl-phosphate-mannose-protein mannosyltransferase